MNRLLLALALVAATALAWAPLADNAFVNYDDDLYVTNSGPVRAGLTPESVRWALTSFHGANWFPVTRLSWMLDAELFGMDPAAFHVSSGVLHAAAAVALFFALASLTGAALPSAFAAGVFALHPLHVESVAWASARKDVLSGLFFALALWAWAGFAREGGGARRARYAAALACLALGLMAKQVLVTLPFLLLLLDVWPLARLRGAEGRLDPARMRRVLVEKVPLLLVVVAASAVAVVAQREWGTVQTLDHYPVTVRVGNAVVSVVDYVRQAFWPAGLSVFYPHPGDALPVASVAAASGFIVAVTGAGLWLRRRFPPLLVGWLWFVGMLVPVIGLVQLGQAARADRYTYLPLVGLSLPVAWGLSALASRGRAPRAVATLVGVAILGGLGVATHRQVQVWRDSESLFRHALAVTTDNHVAHMNLGLALTQSGRLDEASRHLMAAVRLVPASPMARGLLGELRLRQERWREAVEHFEIALGGDRDRARWSLGMGTALLALGEGDAALERLEAAVAMRPGSAPMHASLANARAERGDTAGAIAGYREALRLEPDSAPFHARLASVLEIEGDLSGARRHYERSLALRPAQPKLQARLGRVLDAEGRGAEAALAYRRAVEGGLRSPTLLNNLAWLLATSPDPAVAAPEEAVAFAEEAAAQSATPEVLDTLSVAYRSAGRTADAVATARRALAKAERRGDVRLAAALRRRLAELSAANPR